MSCLRSLQKHGSSIKQKHSGRASYLACFLRLGTLTQLNITQGHVAKERGNFAGKWLGYSLPPPIHPLVFRAQSYVASNPKSCVTNVSRVADIHRPNDEEEE